jgi:hypothetical protein
MTKSIRTNLSRRARAVVAVAVVAIGAGSAIPASRSPSDSWRSPQGYPGCGCAIAELL